MHIPLPWSVATVETLACRRDVQFVVEIGLHEVTFEGDTAVVINAISNSAANQPLYGHIVDDILAQASLLSFSKLCFVNRSCNKVANALAKRANIGPDLQVWLEDCPKDIVSGVKKFSFQQIRFILGWRSKPKLNDGLDARPKGYR